MSAKRPGQSQILFYEDDNIKLVLQQEALKEHKSLAKIMRELIRGWLAQRGIKIKVQRRVAKGGKENVIS